MRNRYSRLILSLLLITCFGFSSRAQGFDPRWHNFVAAVGVSDFLIDSNFIWVSTLGGLVKYNKATHSHINFTGSNSGLIRNQVKHITKDAANNYWFSNGNYGIFKFDGGTSWEYIPSHPVTGEQFMNPRFIKNDLSGNTYIYRYAHLTKYDGVSFTDINLPDTTSFVTGVEIDTLNSVWVAAAEGIYMYNGTTWQVFDSTNSIIPNFIPRAMGIDNNNVVHVFYWTSQGGKMYYYSNGTWNLHPLNVPMVNAEFNVYFDDLDNMWMFGYGIPGLKFFNGTNYTSITISNSSLPGNDVSAFQIDSDGKWYLGVNGAFYVYDGVSYQKIELSNSGFDQVQVRCMDIDQNNVKWFGQYTGVIRYDGFTWQHFNVANSALVDNDINDILVDDNNLVWVGYDIGFSTTYGPLAWYDGNAWSVVPVQDVYNATNIYQLAKDKTGNIWAASNVGVLQNNQNVWTLFTSASLGLSTSGICNIAVDDSNRVWLGSYSGVHKYENGVWTLYNNQNSILQISGYFHVAFGYNNTVFAQSGDSVYTYNNGSWSLYSNPCPSYFTPTSSVLNICYSNELWWADFEKMVVLDSSGCEQFSIFNSGLSGVALDVVKDIHGNIWLPTINDNVVVYNENGINPETFFSVPVFNARGSVFYDINNNGIIETGIDFPFSGRKMIIEPDSLVHFTNSEGEYNFSLDTGQYVAVHLPSAGFQITTDSTEYHFTISSGDVTGMDFGTFAAGFPDEQNQLNLTGGIPRCNLQTPYWINYYNSGTIAQSGTIRFIIDPLVAYVNANPAPDIINGDTLVWNYTNLIPFQGGTITVNCMMPALATGLLDFSASMSNTAGTATSVDSLNEVMLCSYDPNDKLAFPPGIGSGHLILETDSLTYTIRFQNTGNDTAFFVMLIDTLDENLDWDSFEPIASSHPNSITLSAQGVLTIRFSDINLVWESLSSAASQGFFKYRIKPLQGLPDSSIIKNSAHIYFDFNLPVITNEVFHTVVESITALGEPTTESLVKVYPVPAKDKLIIQSINEGILIELMLFDISGKRISVHKAHGISAEINTSELQPGVYLLKFILNSGRTGFVKVVITN